MHTRARPARPHLAARQVVLGSLPPGFLDYKGRDLRDKLDVCLEKNMWFFSIGGAQGHGTCQLQVLKLRCSSFGKHWMG